MINKRAFVFGFFIAIIFTGNSWAGEIHEAAKEGELEKVKELLEKDPTLINAKDKYGHTPLHMAAMYGHKEAVDLLLNNGADLCMFTKTGWTPLHFAAMRGHKDVCELLISRGADVNYKSYEGDAFGDIPLHLAAFSGKKEIVELLISEGSDINSADKYGQTTLHSAALRGRLEIVELLISNGAEINPKMPTTVGSPLHDAACGGHKDVVAFLIDKGADVNAVDLEGNTPLHKAVISEFDDFLSTTGKDHNEITKFLIENGAKVNTRNKYRKTPLRLAIEKRNWDAVFILIKHGGWF